MQCACVCRLVNSGFLLSATFKLRYPSQHKILPRALKWWFSFEIKGLKGCHIAWLVWRLTMSMAQHYRHQMEMKRWRFIKNKVVAWHVATSVKKALLIQHTNVIHLTLVGANMLIMHGCCKSNTILMSIIIFMPTSLNMHLAHANGHCMGICASTRLFSWHVSTLFRTISLIIEAHGMGLIMVNSRQCL